MELLTTEKKESPKIFKVITTDSVDEILQYISNIITKKETPQTESSVNVAKSLVCANQKSRE